MTLPSTTTRPVPDWQCERLNRWLCEWELCEAMGEADDAAPKLTAGPMARSDGSGDEDVPVGVGDVRLLHPAGEESWQRPVHVAVLSAESPDRVLVAPFGPFAEPAVPGELLLRGLAPGVQVLCVWNRRPLSRERLKASWLVTRLADAELGRIQAVHRHIDGEESLPQDVVRDVGPPLAHPLDPRHEYLARERSLMESLVRERHPACTALAEAPSLYLDRPRSELRLAADDHLDYRPPPYLTVPGYALRLALIPLGTGETELQVTDDQHRPSAALDGSYVQLPDGFRTSVVASGRTVLPPGSPVSGLTLFLPNGRSLPLESR
jgi:hypothetical protein